MHICHSMPSTKTIYYQTNSHIDAYSSTCETDAKLKCINWQCIPCPVQLFYLTVTQHRLIAHIFKNSVQCTRADY